MVSEIIKIITAFILVIRNFIYLIFSPYKTIRKISSEDDYYQIGIIFFLVFVYFKFIYYLRTDPHPATFVFLIFLINFLLTTGFFYLVSKNTEKVNFRSFVFTFSYSLFPTLIWFLTNSILYILFPPPRFSSLLGKGFSIFFITFSISLLVWKLILFYLSLRFSTKFTFFRIVYLIMLYLAWFIPLSIFLYHFKIFRIPFI
jgi:hypothetical protein